MISRRVLFSGVAAALVAFAALLSLLLVACSKPEPPKLVPKEAKVTAVGPAGLSVLLRMEATNPNRFTLSAQSVSAKATLDGKWELGAVTISKPLVLPPSVPTMIDVPLTLPWTDIKALGGLAAAPGPVPYTVEGIVKVGGEKLNVDLPFSLTGTITREEVVNAALKGLPAIPGLNVPIQH